MAADAFPAPLGYLGMGEKRAAALDLPGSEVRPHRDASTQGGIFIALELAGKAYEAHALPYEQGLAKMHLYDPRRFTWFYDETGDARDCVKVRDSQTNRLSPLTQSASCTAVLHQAT